MAVAPLPRPNSAASHPISVLVVDDSAVVRGITARWLRAEPWIGAVTLAFDGADGVAKAGQNSPDVVVLDVEMPRLDGLAALPKIRAAAPNAHVVMASTLTRRNADITLKALSAGASDYVAKPEAVQGGADAYRTELLAKVRALAEAGARAAKPSPSPVRTASARPVARPRSIRPKVLAIGSSTGGPQALRVVIGALAGRIDAPILITQHMPATFTTILAEHLDKAWPAGRSAEAVDGEALSPGRIYVAPGDHHMTIVRRPGGATALRLDQGPPVNYCRPAVDPLFRSVAEAFPGEAVAVVLTGMGQDGAAGAQVVQKTGGVVIAQDEATSVVWGMPGATARVGAAAAVKPLDDIAKSIENVFAGGAP